MKTLTAVLLTMFLLTSCNGWFFQPSYNPPTPFLPPTNTPSIFSPTPVVIGVYTATPIVATSTAIPTGTPIPMVTDTPSVFITDTPTDTPMPTLIPTETVSVPTAAIFVEVLGCNTGFDVTHNLGEVTNAYITLKNTGTIDLTNITATLKALDEGGIHPDKTVELTLLPVNYQVTIKLTVDSTYRAESAIQIEITAEGGLFQRVGADSCRDIGLFAPKPESLMTPIPINP